MRPLDPRLLRRSRAARRFFAGGAVLALVQATAIVAFAWATSTAIVALVAGASLESVRMPLVVLVAAVAVRAGATWLWERVGATGANRVKRELRDDLLRAMADPAREPGSTSEAATLAGSGLDALDAYFGTYLPQLLLTAIATPVLIAAVWIADPLSGVILLVVLPLLPVFLALIGLATQVVQRRQWEALTRLSRAFLEVVGGLGTLVLYGRAERQRARIRALTDDARVRTMRVLRVTFLSGFALELGASLSVALVAVSVGLRLVYADVGFAAGLFALLLAPEVFLPLRNVGAAFHASAEGVEAARDALDRIERAGVEAARDALDRIERAGVAGIGRTRADASSELGTSATASASDATETRDRSLQVGSDAAPVLRLRGARLARGGDVLVDGIDLDVRRGEVVALTGPSGAGKSTLLAGLLGLAPLVADAAEVAGRPAGAGARDLIAWMPQTPSLLAGTVAENVALGDAAADPALVDEALRLAHADVPADLPLGADGTGVSVGQAQRVALARAIHRALAVGAPLVLLDEPTSALDADVEAGVAASLRELAGRGWAVLVITHRPAIAAAADRVVALEGVLA